MKAQFKTRPGSKVIDEMEAIEYVEQDHDEPCVYGHYSCAVRDGGMCSNEVAACFNLIEEI